MTALAVCEVSLVECVCWLQKWVYEENFLFQTLFHIATITVVIFCKQSLDASKPQKVEVTETYN